MNSSGMALWGAVGILAVLIVGTVMYYSFAQFAPAPGPVACTADAMLCPDGSYVGRTGPNCEFVCPGATSTPGSTPVAGAGEHCGGFIQNAPVCASGYYCRLDTSRPDTGGTCVADTSGGGGGGFAEYHSGISGTVMLGPTCPVERNPPDPECADRPYETEVVVYRAGDTTRVIASARSNAEGIYSFSLPPGQYVVGAGDGRSMLPRCTNESVTVPPAAYATANISCDTGIR